MRQGCRESISRSGSLRHRRHRDGRSAESSSPAGLVDRRPEFSAVAFRELKNTREIRSKSCC